VDESAVSRQDSISATTESLPKQSTDTTDDSRARLKKKPGNTGFKGMFGTKKKDVESKPPMKPTGAQPSAVAAARAALEGKAKESQETVRPNGTSTLRKPVPAPAAAPSAAPAKVASPPADVEKPVPESQTVTADEQHDGPPKTRRDAEYDALSRVDTNERTAADREFSRFDQGPLMEQPAFAPEDSPVSETFHDKSAPAAAVDETPGRTEVSERATSPTAAPASSSYDRWAQIRKNAAERAAKLEQSGSYRYSQDEGNTSEEESKWSQFP
jgi:hypothetical protein